MEIFPIQDSNAIQTGVWSLVRMFSMVIVTSIVAYWLCVVGPLYELHWTGYMNLQRPSTENVLMQDCSKKHVSMQDPCQLQTHGLLFINIPTDHHSQGNLKYPQN